MDTSSLAVAAPGLTAFELVSQVLCGCRGGDIISTSGTIEAIRRIAPHCLDSDEIIVEAIVRVAGARGMMVSFDRRAYA